jgi:ribosome recycling factor
VETGTNEGLKKLKKGVKVEKIEAAFRWCQEIGIITVADYIIGMPWEKNETDIKHSVDFLIKLDPDHAQTQSQIDGQLIRIPVPDLSEERRNEMKKMGKTTGEKCKVAVRNIRREANDRLKNLLKSKDISEDDEKKFEKIIQTFTDSHIKKIEEKITSKEKEIMTI